MKCKFCSGKHNKGSCPAYGKIQDNNGNKGDFAICCTKEKGIHSLIQEYSEQTAQDSSLSDRKIFFIGTINAQNSNPINYGGITFENTKNRNSFTEHVSNNSHNQVLNDNLVTD